MDDVNIVPEVPLSPEPKIETDVVPEDTTRAPGSKTDPALLLESLKEEREKRRELEERITLLESSTSPDVFSDEGKALQRQIDESKSLVENLTLEIAKKDVLISHPILKEKWDEFETFRTDPENKGMNLKTAAKAFLVENGLLDARRPGLEKPTGGDRTPTPTKMSQEEIKTLRETDFKKYTAMLEKGLI